MHPRLSPETDKLRDAECWVGNGGMGPLMTKLIAQTASELSDCVEHVSGFPDEGMAVVTIGKTAEGWRLGTKSGNANPRSPIHLDVPGSEGRSDCARRFSCRRTA